MAKAKMRGMGSIGRLPSGAYEGRIYIAGILERKAFPKQAQAERWLAVMREKRYGGGQGWAEDQPLKDLREGYLKWLAHHPTQNYSAKTIATYTDGCRVVCAGALGPRPLGRLTTDDILEWLSDLKRDGAKPRSIYQYYAALKSMLRYAHLKRMLDEVPRCPPISRPKDSPRTTLALGDWLRLKKAVLAWPDPTTRLALGLLMAFGLRRAEVLLVTQGALAPAQDGRLWLDLQPLTDTLRTKSGRGRSIPLISPHLFTEEEVMGLMPSPAPAHGTRLIDWEDANQVTTHARPLWKSVFGVKAADTHTLRHTWISLLVNTGFSPTDVQKWAGHAKLETTCGYIHGSGVTVSPFALAAMSERFEREEREREARETSLQEV